MKRTLDSMAAKGLLVADAAGYYRLAGKGEVPHA